MMDFSYHLAGMGLPVSTFPNQGHTYEPVYESSNSKKIQGREEKIKSLVDQNLNNPLKQLEPKKIKTLTLPHPFNEEKRDHQVDDSIHQLQQIKESLKIIQDQTTITSTTGTAISIIQNYIIDHVWKGGLTVALTGVPFILEPSHSPSTIKGIRFITDTLDTLGGTIAFLYQYRLILSTRRELAKIKAQSQSLTPDQRTRLAQVESLINYEFNALNTTKLMEHILRTVRTSLSYVTFSFSKFSNPLTNLLATGAEALIGGLNTTLYGLFFYQAHQNVQVHSYWSKQFKNLVKNNAENHIAPWVKANTEKHIKKIEHRQKIQLETLKGKIARNEITMTAIQEKISRFKIQGVQKFLDRLNIQQMPLADFRNKLQERFNLKLDSELEATYIRLQEIENSENLSSDENKKKLKDQKALLSQNIQERIKTQITQQNEHTLLSQYIDFQDVMEVTIKSSLTEMVKKKHEVERGFLKLNRTIMGTRFTASSIIFGAALALAIVGLATTPFGGAGLILMALSLTSMAITLGLIGAGFYYTYRQKPASTIAILKGVYFRLLYYNAMSIKQEIGNYLESTLQKKTDQLTSMISQLSLFQSPVGLKNRDTQTKEIEIDAQKVENKVKKWSDKAAHLQEELKQIAWADFAMQADLKEQTFDTLSALNEALKHSDLSLLSLETKELLVSQLGIDIDSLQTEIDKDPSAVTVKNLLQNFFNLKGSHYIKFIEQQVYLQRLI